jgi:ABC-type multidrug transport system ATPase subunit
MSAISVKNIEKSYDKGAVNALKGINLEIEEGELFGLIGPDGAGKTSLFRILSTLILPDSGKAELMGFDVVKDFWEIRKIVGYMPGKFSLYQDLSIEENLNFFATVFNTTVKENYHLIEDIYVQIEPFKKRRAGKLSGGMKQKLALCCALIHQPKILLLDEPTTGVDPVSRKEFWDMLGRLKARGITVLVSTPYMDEASRCSRIALMQGGNVMQVDSLSNIISKNSMTLYALRSKEMHRLLRDLRAYEGILSAFAFGDEHHARLNTEDEVEELYAYLLHQGHEMLNIRKINPEIEDVFIQLMQEQKS